MKSENGKGYILAPRAILVEPSLTWFEKALLMHIGAYGEFYESAKTTAKLLNVSEATVKKAKQKLLRGRYILATKNTGRGKCYIVNAKYTWKRENEYVENYRKNVEKYVENSVEK